MERMDKNEEWNEFLGNLLSCAIKTHSHSKECEYHKQRQEEINEIIESNFRVEQMGVVYDILFEIETMYERENEVVYRQGIKDCAWLLKNLGVLATHKL